MLALEGASVRPDHPTVVQCEDVLAFELVDLRCDGTFAAGLVEAGQGRTTSGTDGLAQRRGRELADPVREGHLRAEPERCQGFCR